MRSGSKYWRTPRPSHAGHAPLGLLKEKSCGWMSGSEMPHVGHACFSERRISSAPCSPTFAIPSPCLSAVSSESARRCLAEGFITARSTMRSMSCLRFLSSLGAFASSWTSPSMRARTNPSRASLASSFANSPLRPDAIGAKRVMRVPSGSAISRSTICCTVCPSIGRPHFAQWGVPARAKRSLR